MLVLGEFVVMSSTDENTSAGLVAARPPLAQQLNGKSPAEYTSLIGPCLPGTNPLPAFT
jgi:hypothetical protein